MDLLFREMRIDAPDKGLAAMFGVNDLVGVKVNTIENSEVKKMEGNLIIAVIANGTTKLLMDIAREAGAKGNKELKDLKLKDGYSILIDKNNNADYYINHLKGSDINDSSLCTIVLNHLFNQI